MGDYLKCLAPPVLWQPWLLVSVLPATAPGLDVATQHPACPAQTVSSHEEKDNFTCFSQPTTCVHVESYHMLTAQALQQSRHLQLSLFAATKCSCSP